MASIGMDGNNQIYPNAYVVVDSETKDSWEWHLHILIKDLNQVNQRAYPLYFPYMNFLHLIKW